jgi:hypothetical protein
MEEKDAKKKKEEDKRNKQKVADEKCVEEFEVKKSGASGASSSIESLNILLENPPFKSSDPTLKVSFQI